MTSFLSISLYHILSIDTQPHTCPSMPFDVLCHQVEGLQTTFPRFPCQLGFGCFLSMGGNHARKVGGKKVEDILLLVVFPVMSSEAAAAMGD